VSPGLEKAVLISDVSLSVAEVGGESFDSLGRGGAIMGVFGSLAGSCSGSETVDVCVVDARSVCFVSAVLLMLSNGPRVHLHSRRRFRRPCRGVWGVDGAYGSSRPSIRAMARTCRSALRYFRFFFFLSPEPVDSVSASSSDGVVSDESPLELE
jgi:hypothetical protein